MRKVRLLSLLKWSVVSSVHHLELQISYYNNISAKLMVEQTIMHIPVTAFMHASIPLPLLLIAATQQL